MFRCEDPHAAYPDKVRGASAVNRCLTFGVRLRGQREGWLTCDDERRPCWHHSQKRVCIDWPSLHQECQRQRAGQAVVGWTQHCVRCSEVGRIRRLVACMQEGSLPQETGLL